MNVFSTSYKSRGLKELLTCLTRACNPSMVVELGTQQGSSAILIAKALKPSQKLITIDLFEDVYRTEPHGKTHANMSVAYENLSKAGLMDRVMIRKDDALKCYEDFNKVDLLHIDICNYYGPLKEILVKWIPKVTKMILIEGGVLNSWQRKLNFRPFMDLLDEDFVRKYFDKCTIVGSEGHALTILTRKVKYG